MNSDGQNNVTPGNTPTFSSVGNSPDAFLNKEGAQERVDYSATAVSQHIDMNPPINQITEPLTGSSVIVDPATSAHGSVNGQPLDENGALPNGFKPGYGPNSAMPRMEKPIKPKMSERIKRSVGNMDKKKRNRSIIIFAVTVLLVAGCVLFAVFSGMFTTDYSETYFAAKDVRSQIQKMKSDANCDKVVEYADNKYTSMQIYNSYIEGCKSIGAGINTDIIAALGETQGVLKDAEIRKRYRSFKTTLGDIGEGSDHLNGTLDVYKTWHEWIVAENAGDTKYTTDEWSEDDLKEASDILIKSGRTELIDYGKTWLEKKSEIADLSYKYYHMTSNDTIFTMSEIRDKRQKALADFAEWKEENEPDIRKVVPLETIDVAKLYSKFNELYDYIRKTYQENYNSSKGGCKELVNSVVCE